MPKTTPGVRNVCFLLEFGPSKKNVEFCSIIGQILLLMPYWKAVFQTKARPRNSVPLVDRLPAKVFWILSGPQPFARANPGESTVCAVPFGAPVLGNDTPPNSPKKYPPCLQGHYARHDLAFHRMIVAAAGNQVLLENWDALHFDSRARLFLGHSAPNLQSTFGSSGGICEGAHSGKAQTSRASPAKAL